VAEAVAEELLLPGPLTLPEVLGLVPLLKLAVGEAELEELRLLLLLAVAEGVPVGVCDCVGVGAALPVPELLPVGVGEGV
jgi:hypothetical protein